MAKLIQMIVSEQNVGEGTPENPHRKITQFWFTDGGLLCEVDPYKAEVAKNETTEANTDRAVLPSEEKNVPSGE